MDEQESGMTRTIKVGIIGANARGGWAAEAHVPAVKGLSGLELAAIATNSQHTANEAAKAFGVAKAYPNGHELISDPEIDLITVATRVPDHKDRYRLAVARQSRRSTRPRADFIWRDRACVERKRVLVGCWIRSESASAVCLFGRSGELCKSGHHSGRTHDRSGDRTGRQSE